MAVAPLAYEGAAPQTVRLAVNGRLAGDPMTLAPGWQTIEFKVPGELLQPGPNDS